MKTIVKLTIAVVALGLFASVKICE
jgi:hypothetical protein